MSLTKTHRRPTISGDDPYSESLFRTMEYRPDFPVRCGCIQDSRAFWHSFSAWYNDQDRHSGIEPLTPRWCVSALIRNASSANRLCKPIHPSESGSANRQAQIISFTKLSNRLSQSCCHAPGCASLFDSTVIPFCCRDMFKHSGG